MLSLDGSLVGRKRRAHVFVSGLRVMSLETVELPGDGSGLALVVGPLRWRVRVPSEFRVILR